MNRIDASRALAKADGLNEYIEHTGSAVAQALHIDQPLRVGERCAVVGWKIGEEGRKLFSGTALYTEAGRLCALATCTWILLRS